MPDSKRDSNIKSAMVSASAVPVAFVCAFTKYLEPPTLDRLNWMVFWDSVSDVLAIVLGSSVPWCVRCACSAIGADVAELLAVIDDTVEWVPSIERVFFGLTLLSHSFDENSSSSELLLDVSKHLLGEFRAPRFDTFSRDKSSSPPDSESESESEQLN